MNALADEHLIDTIDRFINDACETGNADTPAGLFRAVILAACDARTDALIADATEAEAQAVYHRAARIGAQFITELLYPSGGTR